MSGSLGEDLEIEILVRLPAKSLMRFKCVQRSWKVLFKTPTFARSHMHMHVSDNRLMILHHHEFESYVTLLSCDNPTATPTPIKSPFSHSPMRAFSYGHCNGIFCLHDFYYIFERLILWNPTTGEVHVVPQPPSHYHPLSYTVQSVFGFGADPKTNNFKVIKLDVDKRTKSISSAEIYNCSTKSWNPVPVPPTRNIIQCLKPSNKYNTLVNGVYHWIKGYNHDVSEILCFDFRNNQFRELRAPISCRPGLVRNDNIAEINGSLAYVMEYGYYHGPVRLRIWVMDQQGWVQKYCIGPIDPMIRNYGIWKDGAQVLAGKVGQPLTSYNHDGNPVHQFQINVDNYYDYLWIHEYVPSIAPLST